MKKLTILSVLFLLCTTVSAQLAEPMYELPDPLLMNDGRQVKTIVDWNERRLEIADMIQNFGIGRIPAVPREAVKARMDGDTLIVDVTVNGQTLTLKSAIAYPTVGQPPYALMIGTSMLALPKDIFDPRPIARMNFAGERLLPMAPSQGARRAQLRPPLSRPQGQRSL